MTLRLMPISIAQHYDQHASICPALIQRSWAGTPRERRLHDGLQRMRVSCDYLASDGIVDTEVFVTNPISDALICCHGSVGKSASHSSGMCRAASEIVWIAYAAARRTIGSFQKACSLMRASISRKTSISAGQTRMASRSMLSFING
jgi:hypothetical protein